MRTSTKLLLGAAAVLSIACLAGVWIAGSRRIAIEPGVLPQSPSFRVPTERDELEEIIDALQIEYTPPRPVARKAPAAPRKASHFPVQGRVEDVAAVADDAPAVEPVRASAQDAMRRALRQKRPLLERCFNQELEKQASFNGFLLLRVSVAVDGRVTSARVEEGNARDRLVASCMIPHLRSLKLPPVQFEADLLLPIHLQATAPVWPASLASNRLTEGS